MHTGDKVRQGQWGVGRRTAGLGVQVSKPAETFRQRTETGSAGIWAGLTVPGDRTDDQSGFNPQQFVLCR